MEKSKAWYFRFPGNFYAYGPIRFEKPVGPREVHARIKKAWELKRIPRGTEIWTTKD